VKVTSPTTLDLDFGSFGSVVGDRCSRTKAQKEWWVLRRVLSRDDGWLAPLEIWKASPPAPDFLVDCGSSRWGVEVTEGTAWLDQREMDVVLDEPTLIGSHGGRGFGGYAGNQPELEVAGDIAAAIEKKRNKADGYISGGSERLWLLVYVNSNPGLMVHIDELREMLDSASPSLGKFDKVTVLCGEHALRTTKAGWERIP
jgi:hypothetical protein